MKANDVQMITWHRRCLAWGIHAFTASGAFIGIMALAAIYEQEFLSAFWLMGAAIIIDAIDGFFARLVQVSMVAPQIDGALLDNIVDFFTYTLVPAFFLLVSTILPPHWRYLAVFAITLSAAYQFTQVDAKTSDHFFKGFPSYWNIAVFYLYFWQMNPWTNLSILMILCFLSFVPIKYVYLSRLEYLTHNPLLKFAMLLSSLIWGFATAGLLWVYPETNHLCVVISMGYILLYAAVSIYRTYRPLQALV
jgi:phosphatidylcholine synthase